MLKINDPDAPTLVDPWWFLGPKRRRMLERGWPGLFRQHLLNALPVERLTARFHPSFGRPSKELHTLLGMLVLQQMQDLTDAEAVEELAYDERWHYALNLGSEEDGDKYVSERTVRNYRRALVELGLADEVFESLTERMAKVFKAPGGKQRLDSTHILSNMRRLSRIGLFGAVVTRFLRSLRRTRREAFDQVPEELAEGYLSKKGKGCFGQPKPSQAEETLQRVAEDLLLLVEMFKADEAVSRMASYRMLARLLSEQCEVAGGEEEARRVEIKPPQEIRCDSLQNPSDPDAAYDGHKGQGYQVQLAETYREEEEKDPSKPDLITYVKVEAAHLHDGQALEGALESLEERELLPEELLADTAYGSDENVGLAAEHGVELIAPAPGKPSGERLGLEDFEIEAGTGEIVSCPAGEKPQETRRWANRHGMIIFRAVFDLDACMSCEHAEGCPKRWGRDQAEVRYDKKQLRLARRRRAERTQEFREKYRWRSGQEASHSRLKAMTGLSRLRVRTLPRVRYAVALKAAGFNILRCMTAWRQRCVPERPSKQFQGLAVTQWSPLGRWLGAHAGCWTQAACVGTASWQPFRLQAA